MERLQSPPLEELALHLQELDEDPTVPLDTHLLEQCELVTSTPEYRASQWKETQPLFIQMSNLLPKLQQDPAPLANFIIKLAAPYRFDDIKDIDFEPGLSLEARPFHHLVLSLLEKAAASSSDAEALANRPAVIQSIVRLWLCTPETAIASQAARLLTSLLRVSKDEPESVSAEVQSDHYGTAPIWKRLFDDRDIYALYYQYTSFAKVAPPAEPILSNRDRTIAQARLLEWLPHVASMDWVTVTISHIPEIERQVGLTEDQGLMHYAALKMVNTADDMLMHMTLINFFSDLITTVRNPLHPEQYDSSVSLAFLKEEGIHQGIIDFHTSGSPGIEQSFLAPRSAHYISEYVSLYPENFDKSAELQTIRQHIQRNIQKCEPSDLSILAAMPRSTLVPLSPTGLALGDCLLLELPFRRANPDALKTLAAVFHGPPKEELTFPASTPDSSTSKRTSTEQVYARLLTALYYHRNPSLFSDLVSHAEIVAMKDKSLAALTLLSAIITSNWSPDIPEDLISTDNSLYALLNSFPKSALDVVLDPTISGAVLPYLLKPATQYSNLVGGTGSAENAAYQVAMAKFDVLKALDARLSKEGGRHDVVSMVRRRVAEGPWGLAGGAGSRIGTLEL